jgi:DNA-binding transcriptional ArsR family regulator
VPAAVTSSNASSAAGARVLADLPDHPGLADPNRLALLLSIHAAGPISVTDLSVATGMNDTAVSQALRLLRASHLVTSERTGRVIRYQLTDPIIHGLLHLVRPAERPSSPQRPHIGHTAEPLKAEIKQSE